MNPSFSETEVEKIEKYFFPVVEGISVETYSISGISTTGKNWTIPYQRKLLTMQKNRVEIRPIDVNYSLWDNTLEENAGKYCSLRLGFRQIKECDKTICKY